MFIWIIFDEFHSLKSGGLKPQNEQKHLFEA